MEAQVLLLLCILNSAFAKLSDPLDLGSSIDGERLRQLQSLGANFKYVKGSIWPTPQHEERNVNVSYTLDPKNFTFTNVGQVSDVVFEGLQRYKPLTFPNQNAKPDTKLPQILQLHVNVTQPYQPLSLNVDEYYTLEIGAPLSTLTAKTCWGALRGLESFSQLVHESQSAGFYQAHKTRVTDFPRFRHRGFLIDTSRHFVNLRIILKFIDALAYSKFNVLHWHIVDDEAFPFVSRHFPDLANKGARDPKTSVYTPADIQRVIDYARFRGVRVLPEFDTPGHTQSWGGIPNLLTPCYTDDGKPNGKFGPIDPTKESTYTFLKEFFGEISKVFPDQYVHLGGDEVSFACWKSNPDINKWMNDHNMTDNFSLLEQYYEQRLLEIVANVNKKYVIWQEVVDNNVKVKPDTVVNVWKGGWKMEMSRVTKLGFNTILSSCWYLNYISYGYDWFEHYKCDPHDFVGDQAQMDAVIGGTACMWGEFVDGVNLISRTWARAMAVGGRLWSSKEEKDPWKAAVRMWEHRCRYLMRGLNADPIIASLYCRHEYMNESK